ncbi:MAG: dimethyl sulfoxide reductase anchor subunit, partial [Rhodobacteraceae bacterium]|nr:dimethyl sulfoxide reductase anchor subunit [Paracoccaceae bacterium]
MHPAPSLIAFTALSGLGFGLLAFLGFGMPDKTGTVAFGLYGLGYVLASAGLLASTFHLGHPERAWRALTQWRTSWLSRVGVLAIVTLLVIAPDAFARVFLGFGIPVLGLIGAVLALATVFSTGMIYAAIRAVPRWHHWSTPAVFLAASLAGGSVLAGQFALAGPLLLVFGLAMMAHWQTGDRRLAQSGSTMESATGLGALGRVRMLAPPHTGNNYLL